MQSQDIQQRKNISFVFSKTKLMCYISHLDLMRLMARALRRAGIPFYLTEGFHPHPKIKFQRALKLGVSSLGEEGELALSGTIRPAEFVKKMNKQLPEGIKIEKAFFAE